MIKILKLPAFLMLSLLATQANAEYRAVTGATVDGYKISACNPFDRDDLELSEKENIDFCRKSVVETYKNFSEKDINFNRKYVLIKVNNFHYVALNPRTKEVYPMPAFFYERDKNGNKIPARLTFKRNGNEVCTLNNKVELFEYTSLFLGNFYDDSKPYCYEFDNSPKDRGFSSVKYQK